MKLILFALACLLAILLIRRWGRSASPGDATRPRRDPRSKDKPAIPPDEIVDVPYEEYDGSKERKSRKEEQP
ncbi:MAG: hypothetical protein GF346_07625 [Candidatus Eisenbacteria bacterium]|nr:hypothetical protein [Candidatus Latescibacterota bacterium]MBD3302301.1 hypothetical protein [Candidatus Eisenbacteria bacterium]